MDTLLLPALIVIAAAVVWFGIDTFTRGPHR